ncbi:hypothetical protein N7457_005503 [Penicillium paradoxum]|uniref:uncharacterized protein n=1 Tax=Penicillium paradoxum TaxID=176176 RepID=UPI00254981BE|nr:uncharacterized protein N7457_005503 [Penicillium paradoxum]KAJ5780343.1 hypothetical protein N7457_005503 [Penicillium paradoxum]
MSTVELDSVIVPDSGETSVVACDLTAYAKLSIVLTSTGYLGFLGTGFGYLRGCAIADPSRKVISIQGDASVGLHLMELDAYTGFNLDIITVVVNDASGGMSSNGQGVVRGPKNPIRPISALGSATKYDVVARGLDDIRGAVAKLLAQSGPSCINLIVDQKPIHPPPTAMVGLTEDSDSVVVPYYDNIPPAYYKL